MVPLVKESLSFSEFYILNTLTSYRGVGHEIIKQTDFAKPRFWSVLGLRGFGVRSMGCLALGLSQAEHPGRGSW